MVRKYTILLFVVFSLIMISGVIAAPNGADVNSVNSSTSVSGVAGNTSAQAGNVSELIITGNSATQSWQGYSGNVSGAIKLADGSGNVMYNWSLASPSGEIYASTNSSIQWSNIQCFNFTAAGNYSSDVSQAGNTSLYGTNLTQLQAQFGINSTDADSVSNTFNAGSHAIFYTASKQFTAGECKSTYIYDNTGAGVAGNFEEVLLYEPNTASIVFTALLESDQTGYDQKSHDFEMLVLENGHNGDVSTTPYYFFVELQ